jgi:hypothetical protein
MGRKGAAPAKDLAARPCQENLAGKGRNSGMQAGIEPDIGSDK